MGVGGPAFDHDGKAIRVLKLGVLVHVMCHDDERKAQGFISAGTVNSSDEGARACNCGQQLFCVCCVTPGTSEGNNEDTILLRAQNTSALNAQASAYSEMQMQMRIDAASGNPIEQSTSWGVALSQVQALDLAYQQALSADVRDLTKGIVRDKAKGYDTYLNFLELFPADEQLLINLYHGYLSHRPLKDLLNMEVTIFKSTLLTRSAGRISPWS